MLKETKNIRPIIVFSVERSELTKKQNSLRTKDIKIYLDRNSIPYRQVVGSYKGQLENGYIIEQKNFSEGLRHLIFTGYGQESVLRVDKKDAGWLLYYHGGNESYIGKLKPVATSYAIKNHEAFTISGNQAYIFE